MVESDKANVVLYECWVYLADTANVFLAGTIKDTNAAMCQWSFDDQTGDGSNEELCNDLQSAFDIKEK